MKILFRVDVNYRIGFGHLSRCVNLANELSEVGHKVYFIGRGIDKFILSKTKFEVFKLDPLEDSIRTANTNTWLGTDQTSDANECKDILQNEFKKLCYWDWIVIDHYAIDLKWQMNMLYLTKKFLVIDDLFNRSHMCDLLLDVTPSITEENIYNKKKLIINNNCVCLLGTEYALLSKLYKENSFDKDKCKKKQKKEKEYPSSILISFGSSDFQNQTEKVLLELNRIFQDNKKINRKIKKIFIICGSLYKNTNKLIILKEESTYIRKKKFKLYQDISSKKMAKILSKVDLCIGAGGVSMYERCFMGVPSILITVAENQEMNAKSFSELDVCSYLGKYNEWDRTHLEICLDEYLNKNNFWKKQLYKSKEEIDGLGCQRVRLKMEEISQ